LDFEKKINEQIVKAKEAYIVNELLLAEVCSKKAYYLCIEFYGEKHYKTAEVVNLFAVFLFYRKQFDKSIYFFKNAISICHLIKGVNNLFLAINYNGLAHVYLKKGDNENALNYYKKATVIAESNVDFTLSTYIFNYARILKLANKPEQAYHTYQKSIKTAQKIIKTKPEYRKFNEQIIYNCYNDLSEIHIAKDDLQQAKQYQERALQVLENSESDLSTFFQAYKRFEIPAKILVCQKKYKQAIDLFDKAKEAIIEEYQGFEVGKDLANIIHQIGECHAALTANEKALYSYQNALKAVCNNFQPNNIADLPAIDQIYNKRSAIASLSFKARTWLQLYNKEQKQDLLLQAFQTYQLINKLLPITRKDYVEENSKFQLANETKAIYEKAIETCLSLHQLCEDEKYVQAAFQFSESSKAIVLQEKLQADFALQGMEQSVQQQDIDFRSKIAFYQSSINTNKATEGDKQRLKNWQSELWQSKEAYERFQQKIELENPDYYAVKYAQSITSVSNLQEKLQSDSALIEYFTGTENSYVFVITKSTYNIHKVNICSQRQLADIQLFKKLIRQFNKSGKIIEEYQSFRKLAFQLYLKLLEPALQNLDQKVNRLIIIPDGLLHHITFEALLTTQTTHHPSAYYHPKNLDYVCKDYALSYSYSASLLLNTYKHTDNNYKQVFAGFAPNLEDLNRNQEEVVQINDLLKGELLLNEVASIENFQKKAVESKIAHLATHAQCKNDHHQLSSIQFYGKQNLNTNTIENMKINTALTVLSACETGYGFIQRGEGAMSLARSFYLAGCPSLVASLWRANDQSTAKLMLYFYQHLKNGVPKDVALQKAKLQYCTESGLRESHPFYWAGFVQYGNRRALF